ncbi:MAG: RNA polymerase sigma factor [Flavobacteriaceae bacterium]|nr:RNA polymerase sigma factor [Flavobacteriaceae bacterium]
MLKSLKDNICDAPVFSRIYSKYAKDLHDYLYYKFGSNEDINDKVQEAFIKLWDNCKDVAVDKARAFLFRVGRNMMLNEFKHQKVVLKYRETKPKNYTQEDPEFVIREKQFYQQYQAALGKLKEKHRVPFLLSKIEGKTHKEVAAILGITKRAAEMRIYTAFKKIKEEVEGFH